MFTTYSIYRVVKSRFINLEVYSWLNKQPHKHLITKQVHIKFTNSINTCAKPRRI